MDLNTKILIVDDNESIHADFNKVLSINNDVGLHEVDVLESELFGNSAASSSQTHKSDIPQYELAHAYQGQEALDKVIAAENAGQSYAMAFVDVRMPPGWDGIETIKRIWEVCPYIEVVLCTAYSDYSLDEILSRIGNTDKLLFLRKPFDSTAVQQMAHSLIKKYNLGRQARNYINSLEKEVESRTHQLKMLLHELETKNFELVSSNQALEFAALHDPLTRLPNRALLNDRLKLSIEIARRENKGFALGVVDVDKFKEINDTLGHLAGDKVLQTISERLLLELRSSDTVSRLGGDEFALILNGTEREASVPVIKKITDVMKEPIIFNGKSLSVGASLGVAYFPEHGQDIETLLKHADSAMYQAKKSGVGYVIFDEIEHHKMSDRELLVKELGGAILNGGLKLAYQPIVDVATGTVHGLEALCRWPHPARGLIPPDKFIALAEQKGLIQGLTKWVLLESVQQIARWQQAGLFMSIAVNLSVRNFLDPNLPDFIETTMNEHRINPSKITLELTESMMMSDPERALRIVTRFREMGIELSLDDFGTGYSSLAYLKRLPVSELKIDREFIMDIEKNADSRMIVKSTIDLAHNLGMRVVAEGIESQTARDILQAMGCDRMQGYHICKPQFESDIEAWLREHPLIRVQQAG